MIKKFQRILSGVLAAMFVGQVMIYGDGSSQGIAHAETISEIKESLQLSENADALQQEYENSIDGLGEVDYFEIRKKYHFTVRIQAMSLLLKPVDWLYPDM